MRDAVTPTAIQSPLTDRTLRVPSTRSSVASCLDICLAAGTSSGWMAGQRGPLFFQAMPGGGSSIQRRMSRVRRSTITRDLPGSRSAMTTRCASATRTVLGAAGVVVIEPGALETQIFDKAAASYQKATAALPPEQVRLYNAQLEAVGKAMGKMKPSSTSILADAVVTALTSSKPKPRYTIGPDTRLPLRTRDRLLVTAMGLSKVRPEG